MLVSLPVISFSPDTFFRGAYLCTGRRKATNVHHCHQQAQSSDACRGRGHPASQENSRTVGSPPPQKNMQSTTKDDVRAPISNVEKKMLSTFRNVELTAERSVRVCAIVTHTLTLLSAIMISHTLTLLSAINSHFRWPHSDDTS
jgi:hypothetical protein